jgi:hypothetical protein
LGASGRVAAPALTVVADTVTAVMRATATVEATTRLAFVSISPAARL